jgi:hypothetical protein
MVIYAASGLVAGEPLIAIAGANQCCLQAPSGATIPDFVGVLANTPTSQATALTTGTLYFGSVILNPDAIYIAEYDKSLTDIDVVSSTSAATTLGTSDDNMDGGWLYVNSGTGVGQLAFIGAASTTVMTLDTTAAWTTTPDSSSDVILIRPPFALNVDLNSTDYSTIQTDEDCTGLVMPLENYIESATIPFGPMRPRQHHMKTGLNNDGVKFYTDIRFIDNIFNKVVVFTS